MLLERLRRCTEVLVSAGFLLVDPQCCMYQSVQLPLLTASLHRPGVESV